MNIPPCLVTCLSIAVHRYGMYPLKTLFSVIKAELNCCVPRLKQTPPIVQIFCGIGQLEIGREWATFNCECQLLTPIQLTSEVSVQLSDWLGTGPCSKCGLCFVSFRFVCFI